MVSLDILATIDVTSLQTIIRTISPGIFSQVLKMLNEDVREKILAILPTGAQARIRQEIELGRPLNPQRLETEKRRVINIIRRMEAQGLIQRKS